MLLAAAWLSGMAWTIFWGHKESSGIILKGIVQTKYMSKKNKTKHQNSKKPVGWGAGGSKELEKSRTNFSSFAYLQTLKVLSTNNLF